MTIAANIKAMLLPATALGGLALVTGLAVQGWAAHGEAIFLAMLDGGFLTCL